MKEVSLTFTSPTGRTAAPGQLFFDIETTGLSAERAMTYLIGCAWYEENGWHLKQWFADRKEAENELLKAFASHCTRFDTLVHFNGNGFDIPFLSKRYERARIPAPFSALESLDLYRMAKPLKKLLGLNDLKQKTLERFLAIGREDKFSGGDLIELYRLYLGTRDPKLERFLLLHNEEDIKGMTGLLAIPDYLAWQEDDFVFEKFEKRAYRTYEGNHAEECFLTFTYSTALPAGFSSHHPSGAVLAVRADRLTLRLPVFHGTLKHYYSNYRDYYYLPLEGKAIHKSVASFVDPTYREKASRENCCVTKEGAFLPQPCRQIEPVFQTGPKEKVYYFECCETSFRSAEKNAAFLKDWLKCFASR
ncbi:MAG: ribonuclease H-like domain-containing protein [Lachnospiraceae bacterium]|nr:ribonuclease H-like domain-containing protein [Lachnospiraceae bacterium]